MAPVKESRARRCVSTTRMSVHAGAPVEPSMSADERKKRPSYSRKFDVEGDGLDETEKAMMKYDVDGTGTFTASEVKNIVHDLAASRKQVRSVCPIPPAQNLRRPRCHTGTFLCEAERGARWRFRAIECGDACDDARR